MDTNGVTRWAKEQKTMIASVIGAGGVGAWLGSSIGIVALGTGLSGMLPLAVIFAVIAWLVFRAFRPRT